MAEPQLIVFISPDVNYALCVFFCGVHRILQVFVRKYVHRTQGCAVLTGFEKQDDESKRQGRPSLYNRSTLMHRLPILAARIRRSVPGAGNHYGFHISQSYQGMAVNITTGARGDRLGPGASQIGSQLPLQTKTSIFPTTFLKEASVKTSD